MLNKFNKLKQISMYKIWLYTLISLLIKSIIFMSFIVTPNASGFNLSTGLAWIPNLDIYIFFIAIFLSFALLFKNHSHVVYLMVINTIFSLIFLFDLWYYRGFGNFMSIHLLDETANLNNLSDSIFSLAYLMDSVLLIDIIILIVLLIIVSRKKKFIIKRNILAFILILGVSIGYISLAHYRADVKCVDDRIIFRICWTPNQTMGNLSPIGYHLYDAYNYYEDCQPLVLKEKEKEEIQDWYSANKENLPDNNYKAQFKGKNLIFLQFESLENFVINKKIKNQEITPNINKLLSNSYYFSSIHEQVNNGTSSDSDLMTNTSIFPVRRGSTFFRYPNNPYNSLPNLLEEDGYSTVAIHPDKGAYWNWLKGAKSIGFEKCIDASYFKQDDIIGLGLSDESFLRQVAPIIEKQKQPFYSFIVTLTSHGPFNLPKEKRELSLDKTLDESKLGGYFQSIHYTDKAIGKFISELESKGIMDNTILVIFGDHCGVHKYYQDEVDNLPNKEDWWIDNHKQIPLIMYEKGLKPAEFKTNGGQIDIFPTAAYLMGINTSKLENNVMGRNLLNTKRNFSILNNKEFIGNKKDTKEVEHAQSGINIADLIIRSNYFKDK